MASQSAAVHKSATVEIRVQPINGFIGAEIEGVDLRRPLSPAQFKIVHDALVQYEVIVLRDQDITVDQQMAFGALFGELSIHPFSPNLADKLEVIILDYSDKNPPALTDIWHVDETFRETPPLATILRGKTVPEVGGDTLFAHSDRAKLRKLEDDFPNPWHPVVRVHPVSGRRVLYVNQQFC
ncbi:MAG TPA: TauD/TfdA family dioxygenase, partial [Reyranella sp.]|nr:TauD/TfdA family dioxygenase [Reyranella sp.]